jgi:hypothetical protein
MTLAKALVKNMGKRLIGRTVVTHRMGSYPGGYAKVVEIHPDPAAPEISFNVKHNDWKDEDGNSIMGIFEYEDVELLRLPRAAEKEEETAWVNGG